MKQAFISVNENKPSDAVDLSQITSDVSVERAWKDDFDSKYVEFIAELGQSRTNEFWWAHSLSEKNELLSQFYPRLTKLTCLSLYLKKNQPDNLLLYCEDTFLLKPVILLLKKNGYRIKNPLVLSRYYLHKLLNQLRFLVKLALFFVKQLYRLRLAHTLEINIEDKNSDKPLHVVKSWIDHRSFNERGYDDAYFTKLIDFLRSRDSHFIVLGDIIQKYKAQIKNIQNEKSIKIIPLEYFAKVGDVFKVIGKMSIRTVKSEEVVFNDDLEVTTLVNDELSDYRCSNKFLQNLKYYFYTRKFAQNIPLDYFIYTFENYAWEKMCIKALKDIDKNIKCVGFQHAFISRNSFKYFIGSNEAPFVPKPDKIVTMGEVTKRILNEYGNWPGDILHTGCALRQPHVNGSMHSYGKSRDILVPFTMTADESIRILNFLNKAGMGEYANKVILRFHPQTPVKKVLQRIDFTLPKNFEVSGKISVQEDLDRAGVVLCTWTTVGMEAIQAGIPVIFLDVNPPLRLDPLFEVKFLKTEVSDPKALKGKIEQLLNLKKEDYQQGFSKTRDYVKKYFGPITQDSLTTFVN